MNTDKEMESVCHLLELGYEDPRERTARAVAEREHLDAQCRRAESLLENGHLDESIALLEELGEQAPDWAPPHHLLARAYFRAGRSHEAAAQLDWLTFRGFESPQLALLAAAVALAQRRFDDAMEQAKYACCIRGGIAGAHRILAEIHFRCGRLKLAEEQYLRELETQPADAGALAGLAAVALRRGQSEQAADWALQALEQNMHLAAAHFRLGVALARLGRPLEAITALETAARLYPRSAAPFRWLEKIADEHLHDPERGADYRRQGRVRIADRRARQTNDGRCPALSTGGES